METGSGGYVFLFPDVVHLLTLDSCFINQRMSSGINGAERCKLSVITEAVSDSSLSVPPSTLLPYEDHLHPRKHYATIDPKRKPDPRRYGHPLVATNLVPLQGQVGLGGPHN